MGSIKFFLLGKFRIEVSGNTAYKIESRKAEELLVYLLLNKEQPHSREQLADILWREISRGQANSYLRKALWQLQSSLESFDLSTNELIRADGEYLQINPQFDLWLDANIFENAFQQTQGILGRDLDEDQLRMLEGAVKIYKGELLDDWYSDWCLYDRERLQHLFLAILDKLMDYCELHGAYENGLIFGEKILYRDRARERTHRRLMRLYYWSGDRTAAIRQFQICTAALKEELDVEPANTTRLVYEQIRADKLDEPPQYSKANKTKIHRAEPDPLKTLYGHLLTFQRELSQMQKQVMDDMRILQKSIKDR